jgi:hypothetical protein
MRRRVALAHSVNKETVSATDEVFAALDGQTLEDGGESWRVRVLGVHAADSAFWVQAALDGPRATNVTVRIRRGRPASMLRELGASVHVDAVSPHDQPPSPRVN